MYRLHFIASTLSPQCGRDAIEGVLTGNVTEEQRLGGDSLKMFRGIADGGSYMVNPLNSAHATRASLVSQAAVRQPQPQPQPSPDVTLPQDTVSLKSTSDVDHDGDRH